MKSRLTWDECLPKMARYMARRSTCRPRIRAANCSKMPSTAGTLPTDVCQLGIPAAPDQRQDESRP